MPKLALLPLSAAICVAFALGVAGSKARAQAITIPKPGAETKALSVFVGTKKKAGKKHPPMMKPVDSKGSMTCAWTAGQLWLACDVDEKITGGPIREFQAHVTMGWDFNEKGYRAFIATMQGGGIGMNGWRDGSKLIFQSQELSSPLGKLKMRWTFDLADKDAITFRDERSINGMPWFTFEQTTLK